VASYLLRRLGASVVTIAGISVLIFAMGHVIYQKAKQLGRGNELPTDWFTQKEIP